MQIQVDTENEEPLIKLAKFNRRSPTQEANLAIADHLNGVWVRSDKLGLSPRMKNKSGRMRKQ